MDSCTKATVCPNVPRDTMDLKHLHQEACQINPIVLVSIHFIFKLIGCDSSCVECFGANSNQCTSCPSGYYLQYLGTFLSYGACLQKTSSTKQLAYYVSPTPNTNPIQSIQGTVADPYYDLEEAINRAFSDCAPFTSCNVTIYMMKGDHYLLREVRDYYRPVYYEIN